MTRRRVTAGPVVPPRRDARGARSAIDLDLDLDRGTDAGVAAPSLSPCMQKQPAASQTQRHRHRTDTAQRHSPPGGGGLAGGSAHAGGRWRGGLRASGPPSPNAQWPRSRARERPGGPGAVGSRGAR